MIDVPVVYVSRLRLLRAIGYILFAGFICGNTVLFAIAGYGARAQFLADNAKLFGAVSALIVFIFASILSVIIAIKIVVWQLPGSFTLLISDKYINLTAKQVTCRIPTQNILAVSKVSGRGLDIQNWFGGRVFVPPPAMLITMRPGIEPDQYIFPLYSMPESAQVIIDSVQRRLVLGSFSAISLSAPPT